MFLSPDAFQCYNFIIYIIQNRVDIIFDISLDLGTRVPSSRASHDWTLPSLDLYINETRADFYRKARETCLWDRYVDYTARWWRFLTARGPGWNVIIASTALSLKSGHGEHIFVRLGPNQSLYCDVQPYFFGESATLVKCCSLRFGHL